MLIRVTLRASLLVAAVLATATAQAAVQTHALFSDNAVLQQKAKLPVWGTTDSSEAVKVALAGQ